MCFLIGMMLSSGEAGSRGVRAGNEGQLFGFNPYFLSLIPSHPPLFLIFPALITLGLGLFYSIFYFFSFVGYFSSLWIFVHACIIAGVL